MTTVAGPAGATGPGASAPARPARRAARPTPLMLRWTLIGLVSLSLLWGTAGAERLLDCDLNERALRFGLEKSYRALARLASRDERRIELVDLANDVRPRTRF